MNHAVRSSQPVPYASFDCDEEEISVVRRISWRAPRAHDAPEPVYVSVLVPDGGDTFAPRHFYLGTHTLVDLARRAGEPGRNGDGDRVRRGMARGKQPLSIRDRVPLKRPPGPDARDARRRSRPSPQNVGAKTRIAA